MLGLGEPVPSVRSALEISLHRSGALPGGSSPAARPWPNELWVEQDLIFSRLIIDIANHDLLGPELAFRGGTCLHKLHLPTALRYSEDLDYVRTTHGPVGAVVDALRDVTAAVGLQERSRRLAGMSHQSGAGAELRCAPRTSSLSCRCRRTS